MALVLKDRVLETTTTTGTGSLTLNGAPSCYQSFNAAIGVGNTTYYAIFSTVADQWETGLGTLSSSNVLARTTIYESSNGGAAVNFTAGTKNVFVTLPASQYSTGTVTITGGTINNTAIGNSTPSTGAFTTLSASSTVSGTGFSNYLASPPAIGGTTPNIVRGSYIGINTTAALTNEMQITGYSTTNGPTIRLENTNTTITAGNVYGNIDFFGNDASTSANGVRVRMSGYAAGTTGAGEVRMYAAPAGSTTLTQVIRAATNSFQVPGDITAGGVIDAAGLILGNASGPDLYIQANTTYGTVYRINGSVAMLNTDTQVDVDLTSYVLLNLAQSNLWEFSVVGTYIDNTTTPTFAGSARLFKSWAQQVVWTGTTYQINGAVLRYTAYNSDGTNFPAGAVNATRVLTVVSATQFLLRLVNRTTPAATSQTHYVYDIKTVMVPGA